MCALICTIQYGQIDSAISLYRGYAYIWRPYQTCLALCIPPIRTSHSPMSLTLTLSEI